MTLASWAQDEVLTPIIANRTHSDRDQTFAINSSTKATPPRHWKPRPRPWTQAALRWLSVYYAARSWRPAKCRKSGNCRRGRPVEKREGSDAPRSGGNFAAVCAGRRMQCMLPVSLGLCGTKELSCAERRATWPLTELSNVVAYACRLYSRRGAAPCSCTSTVRCTLATGAQTRILKISGPIAVRKNSRSPAVAYAQCYFALAP